MLSVSEEIKSPAFLEAASIAVIRAPCSEATDSSRLLFAPVAFLMNGPVRKQSCKSNHEGQQSKNNCLAVGKSEEHSVTLIYTKTPHVLAFRLELFGVE